MCIASIYRVTTERSNLTSQGTSVDRSIVLRRERWTNRRAGAIPLEPLSDEEEIYLNPLFECAGVGRGSAVAFCCVKPCTPISFREHDRRSSKFRCFSPPFARPRPITRSTRPTRSHGQHVQDTQHAQHTHTHTRSVTRM